MEIEDAARSAVDIVAEHLLQTATGRVNQVADAAVDRLADLVLGRLNTTATGRRRVHDLRTAPGDPGARRAAAEVVGDEAGADPGFGHALAGSVTTVHSSRTVNAQWSNATYGRFSAQGHNVAAAQGTSNIVNTGRLKQSSRTFHIGSVRFGLGGLLTGVTALIGLVGGGTAAVVATHRSAPDAVLSDAVGQWRNAGGVVPLPGGQFTGIKDVVLSVRRSGSFALTFTTVEPVVGSTKLTCSGRLRVDGAHLAMDMTAGLCNATSAVVAADKQTITLSSLSGDAKPMALHK